MDRSGRGYRVVQVLLCLLGAAVETKYCHTKNHVFIQTYERDSYTKTFQNVFSSVTCAVICKEQECGEYNYEGKECQISGKTVSPMDGPSTFKLLPGNLTNVAYKKPVQVSSNPAQSYRLNDDKVCNSLPCCYDSRADQSEYWVLVNLTASHVIYTVNVTRRSDCCRSYYRNVEVLIGKELGTPGNFSGFKSLGKFTTPRDDAFLIVYQTARGIEGQYVALNIEPVAGGRLFVCDVKVMGLPSP